MFRSLSHRQIHDLGFGGAGALPGGGDLEGVGAGGRAVHLQAGAAGHGEGERDGEEQEQKALQGDSAAEEEGESGEDAAGKEA